MKILVMNLLRIGDVIAMAPAIKAIRRRYPSAQIHLMINSNFTTAAELIVGVDVLLKFERDRLQRACIDAERPMFEAYDWLQRFVEETSDQSYDMIYNFTHNRLSGWLCGLIDSPTKIGLVLDGSGAVSFGASWFRQLNQQVDFDEVQCFNHTDVFLGAVGAWDLVGETDFFDNLLSETDDGRREVAELTSNVPSGTSKIVFQISTSDAKKEWGDFRFRALAETILRARPAAVIYVTGALNERERIEAFCRSCEVSPESIQPAILSLTGVVSLLEEAELLVTGDTSIKHIASAGTVKVIELIVGSADAYRTGGWKSGDYLIASRESCAPCGHSEACHRVSHACAESIAVEAVARLALSILSHETPNVTRSRMGNLKSTQAFIVDRSEGPVQLVPLTSELLTDQALALSIERAARRLALEKRENRFTKLNVGSEMLKVQRAIVERFPNSTATEFRHALGDGEKRLRHAEGIVNSLKMQLLHLKESFQDRKRMQEMISMVTAMRSRLQRNPWTRFVAEPLVQVLEDDRSAAFTRFRKLSDSLQDLELRLEISLKLLRGLENEFENEDFTKSTIGDRV